MGDRPRLVVLGGNAVPIFELVRVVVAQQYLDIPAALHAIFHALQNQMRVTAMEVGQHRAYHRLRWLLHHAPSLIRRDQHGRNPPA